MITAIDIQEIRATIIQDPGCKVYICINDPPKFLKFAAVEICPALAPHAKLVQDLKLGFISKDEFKRKYSQYLKNNPLTRELDNYIVAESKIKNVYLVCNSHSDCHRVALMSIFDNILSHAIV